MSPTKAIDINGQVYPVRYDVNSYCEFEEITGRSLINGFAYMDVRSIRALVFVGMKSGHKFQFQGNIPFNKTLDEVGELIDLKSGMLKNFISALHDSLGITPEDLKKENEKPGE